MYFERSLSSGKGPRLVPNVITVVIYVEVISVEVKSIALRVNALEPASSTC